jgi:hypothetical protein
MASFAISRPSETSAGQVWLNRFIADERSAATILIDSLEIRDHVEILNGLRGELLQWAEDVPTDFPASLISVRSLEDLPALAEGEHVAFDTFNPGEHFPALPGSEADIGGMCRSLIESKPDLFLPPGTTLPGLKDKKARSLILITDYCGSGKQVQDFAASFTRNTTIASWISLKLMKIHVLTYASSMEASRLLGSERHVSYTTITSAKSAKSANWSTDERTAIEALCLKHADTGLTEQPLGYKGSFGLYLSNLRVPNNLPQILIRAGGDWPGLFANRQVPNGFYSELRSYVPDVSLEQTLRNLGAADIADRIAESNRPVPGLRALAALHLLEYKMTEDQVFEMLNISSDDLAKLRATLISLGLMTLENRVTPAGRRELQLARRTRLRPARFQPKHNEPIDYLPTQLR